MSSLICGFIGLGLIGGSIAKALKGFDPSIKIIAYDTNYDSLRLAVKEGTADIAAKAIDESFSDCDYLFLCAPVQKNDGNLAAVKSILGSKCLLTDVGSVKSAIHEAVREAGLEDRFIGGHPMTGSERQGYASARVALLENAYYILTPTPSVPMEKLEAYRELVTGMGAIPLVMDWEKHDYVTAAISHLPHVAASSLVNLVRDRDSEDGIMKLIAAGGFKDITRIASSSAVMWQQICLANKENISALLSDYIEALTAFKEELDRGDGDALYERFDSARIYRDSFSGVSSGPIERIFGISVEIADKSGTLAHTATLLANHDISIKNIGLLHNRETEDGVLQIDFYTEEAMNMAVDILSTVGYTVAVRA